GDPQPGPPAAPDAWSPAPPSRSSPCAGPRGAWSTACLPSTLPTCCVASSRDTSASVASDVSFRVGPASGGVRLASPATRPCRRRSLDGRRHGGPSLALRLLASRQTAQERQKWSCKGQGETHMSRAEDAAIEARIARLEREARRWRRLAGGAFLGLVAIALMGQARPGGRVVEAERFVLRVVSDFVRAELGLAGAP